MNTICIDGAPPCWTTKSPRPWWRFWWLAQATPEIAVVAWAVFLAAPVALLGPVAFVAYITRFQIRPEERALQQLFGDEFRAYCQQVPRWL